MSPSVASLPHVITYQVDSTIFRSGALAKPDILEESFAKLTVADLLSLDCDIYRGTVNAGAALWVPVASLVAERAKGGDSFMIRTGAIVAEKEEHLMSLDALKVLRGGGAL